MEKINTLQQEDVTPPQDPTISSLQLKNLSQEITAQDLNEIF